MFIYTYTFRVERREYYHCCLMAESEHKKYLPIIINGMDQSKTNLPRATQTPKVNWPCQNFDRLYTSLDNTSDLET